MQFHFTPHPRSKMAKCKENRLFFFRVKQLPSDNIWHKIFFCSCRGFVSWRSFMRKTNKTKIFGKITKSVLVWKNRSELSTIYQRDLKFKWSKKSVPFITARQRRGEGYVFSRVCPSFWGVLVLLICTQILVRLDCFSHSITMEVWKLARWKKTAKIIWNKHTSVWGSPI